MVVITVKEKEYKLNLRMSDVIALEKELGENPLNLFIGISEEMKSIPFTFGQMVLIIKYSLRQFHHGMKDESVLALIEDWLEEEGNDVSGLMSIVMELMQRFF